MATTTVKQPRVIEFDERRDLNFASYLNHNNIDIQKRAYIMHLGINMVSHVNEDFVRVSFPYKRAKSGYGVVILPANQVVLSNVRTSFDEQPMYDVDLGDTASRLTVSYIDDNGEKCKREESTRYIERYLNFTQSGYMAGRYLSDTPCSILESYQNAYPGDCSGQDFEEISNYFHTIDGCSYIVRRLARYNDDDTEVIRNGYNYFEQFKTVDGFDYAACDKRFQEMGHKFKSVLLQHPDFLSIRWFPMMNQKTGQMKSALNAKAASVYLNSYLDGYLDECRKQVYATTCCFYPPNESENKAEWNRCRRYGRPLLSYSVEDAHNFLMENRSLNRNHDVLHRDDDFMRLPPEIEADCLPFQ